MEKSSLLGQHVHVTACGRKVHIWKRGSIYLARGRYERKQFGKSLGNDPIQAACALRRLLVAIEDGSFLRPSESRRRPLKTGQPPRLSIRELSDRFLDEKRRLRGKETAQDYQGRLVPLIEFAEQTAERQRWPLAVDIDRDFAVRFRTTLFKRKVTRNGHQASRESLMSPGQVYNVLDCARSMFLWARRPDVNLLPSTFINPFAKEIVGEKATKDPLRPIPIPCTARAELVAGMDDWQLCQLGLSLVLPLRPEDFAGLLISEVDLENRLLKFGTRLEGRDFNKGRQSFVVPFPAELQPLLRRCIDGRIDGPVLRKRAIWDGRSRPKLAVSSAADVKSHFQRVLERAGPDEIQCAQDEKRLFRGVLLAMGGASTDELAAEFKSLLPLIQPQLAGGVVFYNLRASCNSEMERSGVSLLVQRYVTGHSTNDIINKYASLDPPPEMQKYFAAIQPLLAAIERRAGELGLLGRT